FGNPSSNSAIPWPAYWPLTGEGAAAAAVVHIDGRIAPCLQTGLIRVGVFDFGKDAAEIPRVWDLNNGLVVGTSQVPETGDGHLRQPPADPGNYRNPIYAILSVCLLADRKRKVASRAAVPPRLEVQ